MATTGQAIVNQIRASASDSYRNAVAELNATNLTDVGASIINFVPVYNEFIKVFFNKVVLSIFDMRQYSNPFRALVKGGSPLGGIVENGHVNPATPIPYDINATSRLLHNYVPEVQVEYYGLNRKDLFAVTRARQELELAFTSFDALDAFFSAIIESLYSGNEIREFQLWKALFASAYLQDIIITRDAVRPTNKDSAYEFLAVLQQISMAMRFPGSKYNNYQALATKQGLSVQPAVTWTPPDRQIVIMDSRLAVPVDLYVRASAFNETYTQLQGQIMYVDNLMVTGLMAIICDDSFPQVRDSKREFRDFENGATLTLNSFFHVWQYYNVKTWANAVAIYDKAAESPTITINNGEALNVGVNDKKTFAYTINYKGNDVTADAYLSFTSTTNNLIIGYDVADKLIKVSTSKDSIPGTYTCLVSATVNEGGADVVNTVIITIKITALGV